MLFAADKRRLYPVQIFKIVSNQFRLSHLHLLQGVVSLYVRDLSLTIIVSFADVLVSNSASLSTDTVMNTDITNMKSRLRLE